jgi:sarcosine oxidase, subunit beta
MSDARCDVLVIGGGVTGCAAAYYLARSGAAVTLVERSDLNTAASGRNAGGLHGQIQFPPFAELGEEWAASFAPALELMRDAIELWRNLPDELDADLEVRIGGGILVADSEEQMRLIEWKASLEQRHGIPSRVLARDELRALAPYLAHDVAGGVLCEIEGKANPLLAVPALARAAIASGARLLLRTGVLEIVPDKGAFRVETTRGSLRCERIVNCAGAETGRVSALVGVDLPVEGHPIQASVTEPVAPLVPHLVYFAGEPLTLKQARVGSLLVGGGWPARLDARSGRLAVDLDSLRENLRVALRVVPALAGALILRTWAGVCPGLPDQRPIVGELEDVPGFVVAMFPFLGFTCGPLLGRIAADLALGRDPGRDLAPFSPARLL